MRNINFKIHSYWNSYSNNNNELPEADPSISQRMWNPRRRQDLWCFWALWFSPDAVYRATVSISRKDR